MIDTEIMDVLYGNDSSEILLSSEPNATYSSLQQTQAQTSLWHDEMILQHTENMVPSCNALH